MAPAGKLTIQRRKCDARVREELHERRAKLISPEFLPLGHSPWGPAFALQPGRRQSSLGSMLAMAMAQASSVRRSRQLSATKPAQAAVTMR